MYDGAHVLDVGSGSGYLTACMAMLVIDFVRCLLVWWHGGAIGRASDLRFIGRRFESCLNTIAQWSLANYLHLCASVTKQYNLVPVQGQ